MTSTRICFVRHGETDWNAQKRMQGHIDIPLNATGIIQAKRLAKSLEQSNHRFDQIYASDLERAKHTAQVVADSYGIKVKTLVDLRERHVGKLQGLLLAEAPTLVPHIWQRHLVRKLDYDLEGGESIVQFHKRMHLALEHLHAEHRDQQILVVSHGGSLDMIYRIVTEQALDAERVAVVPNTSLNWIVHDGERWKIERWADTSHLQNDALDNIEI